MLAVETLTASVQATLVVMPVAVYFLVLGLLNSRRHPQLLTGRLDFVLLLVALSPLFLLPVLNLFGLSILATAAAVVLLALAVLALSPRDRAWVIYNVPADQVHNILARALNSMGLAVQAGEDSYQLDSHQARIQLKSFAPLRNVTVRLTGGDAALAGDLEKALCRSLVTIEAQTSPMAMSLLLVATAMMVAPLALMAHRVPEIVRVLGDLLH